MEEKKSSATIPVIIIVILLAAGAYYTWQKATEKPPISDGSSDGSQNENLQNCTVVVNATTTLYSRPSKSADIFGTLTPEEVGVIAGGKTADGWIGFDPAVAQAPNVGPFRLRYIPPSSPITLVGNCASLPVVPSLPPKQCFVMAQSDIPIYESANASSSVVATMHFGDYIEASGTKGTPLHPFVKVQSMQGTLASGTAGYISMDQVNFNGSCEFKVLK